MYFNSERVSLSLKDSYYGFVRNKDGKIFLSSLEDRTCNKTLFSFENISDNVKTEISEEFIAFNDGGKEYKCTFYRGFYAVLKGNSTLNLLYDSGNGYKAHTAVYENEKIRICDVKTGSYIWLEARKGELTLNSSWSAGRINSGEVSADITPENDEFEIVVYKTRNIGSAIMDCPTFEDCCEQKRKDFKLWCEKMQAYSSIEKEMAFVLWQNTVAPLGLYKKETILCNKTFMNAVWSWDNCFHALGVAKAFPELAYYQIKLVFDNMDETGTLPDSITPYRVEFGFTKPPIHAFIYEILMETNPYFGETAQIENIYEPLCKNFNWWLSARENAPVYWHGNESGADNATCFDKFPSVKSPDLYAMLSYTAKMLSKFAKVLGRNTESEFYSIKAKELGTAVESMFFDGDSFFVIPTNDFKPFYSKSLLPLHCIVIWEFLSESCVRKTFELLENEFLGEYGLTSEAFSSDKHIEGQWEAYWRGSTWGCQQIIFSRAAEMSGRTKLAEKIICRYKKALEIGGSAENSNSLTGEGNCAIGFSWTAAVEFYKVKRFKK